MLSDATSFTTLGVPALPALAAPVVSGVGATYASVTLPVKPVGFDSYGRGFGVKLFTGAYATSGEIELGGWSWPAPWGTLQTTSQQNPLKPGTTYWARFLLHDNFGREVLSDATSFTTVGVPALPALAAPVVSGVGATYASVTLPVKPVGFDSYGRGFGVKLFTGAYATSGEIELGGWSWPAPWGTLQTTSQQNPLKPGTTYWARFLLHDNFGREVLSDATSFTTLGVPALPALAAPVVSGVGATYASVTLPVKPVGFDSYGRGFGVKLFTGAYATSGEIELGGWSWPAPWGTLQIQTTTPCTGLGSAIRRRHAQTLFRGVRWGSGRKAMA